jgi:hypothetical protein
MKNDKLTRHVHILSSREKLVVHNEVQRNGLFPDVALGCLPHLSTLYLEVNYVTEL